MSHSKRFTWQHLKFWNGIHKHKRSYHKVFLVMWYDCCDVRLFREEVPNLNDFITVGNGFTAVIFYFVDDIGREICVMEMQFVCARKWIQRSYTHNRAVVIKFWAWSKAGAQLQYIAWDSRHAENKKNFVEVTYKPRRWQGARLSADKLHTCG